MITLMPVKKLKTSRKEKNKLPPDTYPNLLETREVKLSDTTKLVFQVRRGGQFGLAEIDIRTYISTPKFNGFTKKGFTIPIEFFEEFLDTCVTIVDEMDAMSLFNEVDEV